MTASTATAMNDSQRPPAGPGQGVPAAPRLQVGTATVSLRDVTGYRIEDRTEEGPRLGNLIMLNLFVGASLAVFAGIISDYLGARFYLALTLFVLLAVAALDDLVRSRGIARQRLFLTTARGETLAFVTPDALAMRLAAAQLDRHGLSRSA